MVDLGKDYLSEKSNLSSLNKSSLSKNSKNKSVHYNEEEDIISSSEDKINSNLEVSAEESEEEEENEIPAKLNKDKEDGFFMNQVNLFEDNDGYVDNNKLNELLFCCQEIGEFKNKELGKYEKGKYCESSLRDIHRFLANDDPENPIFKYSILNWDIYSSDLIPLLKNYENNDKINSLCLVILCDLTELLPDIVEKRNHLNELLFKLIKNLVQNGIIKIIANNLINSTTKLEENKDIKEIIKKQIEENKNKKQSNNENKELMINENTELNNNPFEINKEQNGNNAFIDDSNKQNKINEPIMKNEDKEQINNIEVQDFKIQKNNNIDKRECNNDVIIDDDNIICTNMINNEINNETKNNKDNSIFNKEKEEEKRNILKNIAETELKCENTIELLLVIIKQILVIFLPDNLKESTENYCTIFQLFSDLGIFDIINFYTSFFNKKTATQDKFTIQISSTLLQLMYYLTRLFEPKTIISLGNDNYNNGNKFNINGKQLDNFDKLIKKEEMELNRRKINLSSRSINFGTRIKVNRPIDNSCFIISNVNELINNKNLLINQKINTFNGQRHKVINKAKKNLIKKKNVPVEKISEEINMINDIKLRNYFNSSANINEKKFIQVINNLKFFFINFLENNFNSFVTYFYYQLGKEDELDKYEVYYLINVINFFIEFNRLTNYENYNQFMDEKKENDNQNHYKFNLKFIEFSINSEYIIYFYNKIFDELVNKDKKEREIYMVFPIMTYMKNIIYVIFDSFKFSKNSDENDEYNFKLNVLLQDIFLTKDLSRIIKQLFIIYNEYYHPVNILYELIEFTEIYYTSLEIITKNRELKIKKRGKKKVNKYDKNDEEKIIKDILNNNNDNSGSDSDSDNYNYVEKPIDVNSESRILVDYEIINKLFLIFTKESDLNKSLLNIISSNNSLVKFINKLFDRIANKTECTWIFYNIKYFIIINNLFNNYIFNNDQNFSKLKKVFLKIIDNFFANNQINKMLPIEILFEFNNLSFIDTMLNNYENINNKNEKNNVDNEFLHEDRNDEEENYYQIGHEDNKDEKENSQIEENEKWSIEDDTILINTYFDNIKSTNNSEKNGEKRDINEENIKDLENNEIDILNICANSLINKNYSVHEIKKRLKKLKVKKGKEKALKKMKKIHKIKNKQNESRNKISSSSSFKFVYDLSEKIKSEEFKTKLNNVIDSILEQIEKYKNRKELLTSESNFSLILVPSSSEEIEVFNEYSFKQLLFYHGFYLNKDNLLQLNEQLDIIDIDLNYDKLKKCKEIINSNVNYQLEKEREVDKVNHLKTNKNKNDDNIQEDENNKNNEENNVETKLDNGENENENTEISQKKQKKKLKKAGKKKIFSIDEEEDEFYDNFE